MIKHAVNMILLLSLGTCANLAQADWVWFSAAHSCSPDAFSIEPTIEGSSGTRAMKKGTHRLLREGQHVLHCKVGRARIDAVLDVRPPDDQPGCGTNGLVELRSLTVNGQQVVMPGYFVSYCDAFPDNFPYTDIRIMANKRTVAVTACKGAWDWKASFTDVTCETKHY
jgi:hypothetical protein